MTEPQEEPGDWIIEASGVGRSFAGQRALGGIDLRIARGEIFGVLGPDGSGKTTLMQILAAILDPTEGACRVLGFDTVHRAAEVTARIGYMSQGFTLYDRLSVEENLAFAARIRGVGDIAYRERRERLLDMAGLAAFAQRRAGQLSGGMRKKLSLCTNLIHEPPLLLLDELSLGVDPVSRRELWRMLRAFRDNGITVVLTTPYMDEAAWCDRLAFLHATRLLAIDTPASLRERARGTVYELHTNRMSDARLLLEASAEVIAVQWFPDRLRFQVATPVALPATLRPALERLGELKPAVPDLENAFVQLIGDGGQQALAMPPTPGAGAYQVASDAVSVSGVTVRFGSFTAVDRVSVSVAAGEVIGWLGPNGAGKTTLIRVLCGLLPPAAGTVHVAGLDVLRAPLALKRRIGYMSQRFSLYPDLTVAENLAFFAGAYGLSGDVRRQVVAWAIQMTGLGGIETRWAGKLSGAQRQRLALACAVLHRPAVLFLDEPTSGVDPVARQRFWELIQALAASGMAVLVTTHYLEEARYCHRLGLMFQGRLIALGSLDELRAAVAAKDGPDADMETVFMAHLARARSLSASEAAA
ncbi:MAG: ABC transporter ATP-binding protein [Thiogranum sp.]|nr:ABC transporter ATP-binding protein [Thiogranum sp.]